MSLNKGFGVKFYEKCTFSSCSVLLGLATEWSTQTKKKDLELTGIAIKIAEILFILITATK